MPSAGSPSPLYFSFSISLSSLAETAHYSQQMTAEASAGSGFAGQSPLRHPSLPAHGCRLPSPCLLSKNRSPSSPLPEQGRERQTSINIWIATKATEGRRAKICESGRRRIGQRRGFL
ncbi:hypothetical protein HPP92_007145 [Vanilla planifolia]|uniref:Uncharacterized protein n=1 Tax=Vanilla planifolia TaxID=51239 RepID=A0A835V5L6_VANPL|nr:hypothetical protein HPP92_007145 [Vanilla planifolia]